MIKFGPHTDGYYDTENQLPAYLAQKAQAYLKKDSEEKDNMDKEAFLRRRERMRAHFLSAVRGLPEERTPLKSTCTGTLERDAYRIEKIIYESLPRFYVTANLYVPKGLTQATPGILFVCGHARAAKADPLYQKVCIDL